MASVVPVLPKNGAKKFRDGCARHWQVRPNPSEAALGVRKETFCRQTAADARRSEIRDRLHRGVYVADDKTSVAEWGERWVAAAKARGARPGSLQAMTSQVRMHIATAEFGSRPMTSVRPDDVRSFITSLRGKGLGAARVSDIVHSLRGMFTLWINDGRPLPRGNPVARGIAPRPQKKHGDPLTFDQVQAWRDALPEDMHAIVDVEAYYGGRMSEVLGLREENIRFVGRDMSAPLGPQLAKLAAETPERYRSRKPTVRFEQQLGYRDFHGPGASVPTKNERARRTLGLPQWLAAVLGEHLTRWPARNGWLFTNSRGPGNSRTATPMPYVQGGYRRWLGRAAERAGIDLPAGQCSHALRHHCVSVLRDRGFSDQAIGEWIGDTAQTIAQTYGRPMPDTLDRMAAVLDEAHTAPRLRVVGDDA